MKVWSLKVGGYYFRVSPKGNVLFDVKTTSDSQVMCLECIDKWLELLENLKEITIGKKYMKRIVAELYPEEFHRCPQCNKYDFSFISFDRIKEGHKLWEKELEKYKEQKENHE